MATHLECIVVGEVQGVFYRRFIKESAEKVGLVGSVRNLPNGTVEVIAEGEEATLHEFLRALTENHPFARVDRVDVVWSSATKTFLDFTILHS